MPVFEKDIVLIYFENDPMGFARVEEISSDIKKNWYHVRLLLLNIPLQTVTWILRDVYIDGEEFTMGGHKMRLEKVEAPKDELTENEFDDELFDDIVEPLTILNRPKEELENLADADASAEDKGKIMSFDDFKNRKK